MAVDLNISAFTADGIMNSESDGAAGRRDCAQLKTDDKFSRKLYFTVFGFEAMM